MSKLGVKIDEVFVAEIVKTHSLQGVSKKERENRVLLLNTVRYALREAIEEHDAELLKLKEDAFALANSISHIR